jgi:glucose-1-phosphate thymidylyltransferase
MKAIVLAGGFAKRMWPLTKNKPKQLLPLAGRPMLDYVLEKLEPVSELNQVFISTNAKFEDSFKTYLTTISTNKSIELFIEDTHSEQEKLGSVGALGFLIRENKIDDELIVIGGDNLFEFQMNEFLSFFKLKVANVVALYDLDSIEDAKLYGVVEVDSNNKIIGFSEKPSQPRSTLVSTACYLFTRTGVKNILRYLDEGNDPDKIGHFIEWLYQNDDTFGFLYKGYWFDIGSFESYDSANEFFTKSNR